MDRDFMFCYQTSERKIKIDATGCHLKKHDDEDNNIFLNCWIKVSVSVSSKRGRSIPQMVSVHYIFSFFEEIKMM